MDDTKHARDIPDRTHSWRPKEATFRSYEQGVSSFPLCFGYKNTAVSCRQRGLDQ